MHAPQSRANSLASLPSAERREFIAGLTDAEALALAYEWRFWARPSQLTPAGPWNVWLNLAGRGFGKTRTGVEWVRSEVENNGARRVAIIAPTAADARKVIVEGESGILAVSPPWFRPTYSPSRRQLSWPNGAIATLYSAEEPERLRGPQHDAALCDELAAWKYMQEAWDQLQFGLRLGDRPRVVITTTPRPVRLIKELLARYTADPTDVVVTRGTTEENKANLAPTFLSAIVGRYQGTRLGRQELDGEVIDEVAGALWSRAELDEHRVAPLDVPELVRVVVAIDPGATSGENADETGIICAGIGTDGHGYVLDDQSGVYKPVEWAKEAIALHKARKGDRIIAEVNNGGEMVETTLRIVDPNVAYTAIHASRGKVMRSEPISALYEQGKVHHVGSFGQLEDQMCLAAGTLIETARGQTPIECVKSGDLVMTRGGYFPVKTARKTGYSSEFVVIETTDERILRCTATHPIFEATTKRFVPAGNVKVGALLNVRPSLGNTAGPSRGAASGITAWKAAITATQGALYSIARFGKHIAPRSLRDIISITSMAIRRTTTSLISECSRPLSMLANMNRAAFATSIARRADGSRDWAGNAASYTSSSAPIAPNLARLRGPTVANSATAPANDTTRLTAASKRNSAPNAGSASLPKTRDGSIVVRRVTTWHTAAESVFNLEIDGPPEFYANGILVHNCAFTPDFDRSTAGYSPDRLDALVWALSELMVHDGAPAIPAEERDFVCEPIEIGETWPRVFAIDVSIDRVAVLWGAVDKQDDTVYLTGEYAATRADFAVHAAAIRSRSKWIPGVIAPRAHSRAIADGAALVERLTDLELELSTVICDEEAALGLVTQRIATKRLRVFRTLTDWLAEYRAYRRNASGKLDDERNELMNATALMCAAGIDAAITKPKKRAAVNGTQRSAWGV